MSDLVDEYRKAAMEHGEHTLTGDSDKANSAYRKLMAILNELVALRQDHLLFSLYDDADMWVQLWASAHTLELEEQRALNKLRLIQAAHKSVASMNAKYTIQEWNKGHLRVRE